jgi:enoyl-CoA hydratase/carnithine racemase
MATIEVERPEREIALVRLARPDRLNALTFAMFGEIAAICAELEADEEVRAVVFTGAGRAFCAGLDLDDAAKLEGMSAQRMLAEQEGWAGGITALRRLHKPVIAAVNGAAAGAGMGLALAADIRIGSPAATFHPAFVRIGLTGGDVGVSWMLPRLVGMARASEILLTGRPVEAPRALEIGLLGQVVEPDELLDAALATAREIAAFSPFGVRLTKQVLQTNVDTPSLEAALELENRNQVLSTRTEDMPEALAAFREKRLPEYKNR